MVAESRTVNRSRGIVLAGTIVYLALSLDHLSVYPPVGEDEPWIAAAPYKLATEGVYGSDLFAGYYGVDRHNYQHMPLYPLMQAALFKALGAGVFQMRLLPVLFGLALLLIVFLVGKELGGRGETLHALRDTEKRAAAAGGTERTGDARVGALAVVLLLGLRLWTGGDATGILFLDRARINRYDIAVPVFGLLALWIYVRAERTRARARYFLVGVLTGLASLSHLFGAFWLPIVLGLVVFSAQTAVRRRRAAALIVLGVLVTWIPWVAYIASGWQDYLGQMRFVAARFDVFNPSFYVSNLLHGGGPISIDWMLQTLRDLPWNRPGAWSAIVGIPAAVAVMAWSGLRDRDRAAWMLAAVSMAQLAMFVLLLKVKTINYMIGLWPLGVLMLAWLGVWLWDRRSSVVRAGILVLLTLILVEGITRAAHGWIVARRAIPYDWFEREIAQCIPAGSRVLGLQHYWLGLRQYSYRTWLLPTLYAHPLYYHDPMPLQEALERVNPDIILVDRYMATFFAEAASPEHPYHATQAGFEAFVTARHAEPICAIRNPTYGTMIVYRVPPAAP